VRERSKYRVATLLDERYEVRTPAGERLGIIWATRVDNRAMRFGLSDGTKAVYPTDAPLFSRPQSSARARRSGEDKRSHSTPWSG
jgi:hypothetical protein